MAGRWPHARRATRSSARAGSAGHRAGLGTPTLGQYYDSSYANALLSRLLAGQERLLACWTCLPTVTSELPDPTAWVENVREHNVRAACVYRKSHGYLLCTWSVGAYLEHLAERHCLLMVEPAEITWGELDWLCGAYGGLWVLLLNPGYRSLRPLWALLSRHSNLYVDTSTLATFMGLEEVCRQFGSARLLFGSGTPRHEGAGAVATLAYTLLSDAEVRAVAGGNVEALLGEVRA